MSTELSPLEHVKAYFADNERPRAIRALRSYYATGHHYTGSAFDSIIARTRRDRFSSDDVLAVSMLSVTVPPRAALHLLDNADVENLLAEIPTDASIWKQPELLDRSSPAWQLSALVSDLRGVGETITSKLLAAKRPELVPVFDRHVSAALGLPRSRWGFWQQVAGADADHALLKSIRSARDEAGVPHTVSALRTVDVVVWMREHGWKRHVGRCGLGCDFAGFENPMRLQRGRG